ncbi:hypothetical protein SDC9_205758 [bioreactor metagenome]|uniref:Uncharacterized protein n=1 Tax=bioreactor metagenome TaxID=1076179 RepID=A0A645J4J6_9ZZZZ
MDEFNVLKAETLAGFFKKIYPLVETVEQRQTYVRNKNLERHARKSRARAYVHDALSRKTRGLHKARAVEEVEVRHILSAFYGGQVHHLVLLS